MQMKPFGERGHSSTPCESQFRLGDHIERFHPTLLKMHIRARKSYILLCIEPFSTARIMLKKYN